MQEQVDFYNAIWVFVSRVALGFMVIPLLLSFRYVKFINKKLKFFLLYLFITLVLSIGEQLVYQLMLHFYEIKNPFFTQFGINDTNFYQILFIIKDFILLGLFFYYLLLPDKYSKFILYLSLVLIFISIINYFFIDGINAFSPFNSSAQALFTFTLPILYMWILYHSDAKIPLYKNPYFWINLGLIIPNLLGLFLYFAGDKISTSDYLLFIKIMIGRSIIEMISQILFTIGFSYGRYAQFLRQ